MTTMAKLCFLLLALLISNVNSQSCRGVDQYGLCSSNTDCGCLHKKNSRDDGICGFLWIACARLEPCQQPGNICSAADHKCVLHPQCRDVPVCYPLKMADQQICPQSDDVVEETTTTKVPTITSTTLPTTTFTTTGTTTSTAVTTTTGFTTSTAVTTTIHSTTSTAVTTTTGFTTSTTITSTTATATSTATIVTTTIPSTSRTILSTTTQSTTATTPLPTTTKTSSTIRITTTTSRPSTSDGICKTATWSRVGVTVAGNGVWGSSLYQLNSPTGIFVDEHRNVYVADTNNARIVRWSRGATYGTVVAGGLGVGLAATQLYNPMDLVVDKYGAQYIIDTGNNRVQKWDAYAQWGQTLLTIVSPTAIAMDNQESLYVASSYYPKNIFKLGKNQLQPSILATGMPDIYNIFVDRNRTMYAPDKYNGKVLKIDANKSQLSVAIGELSSFGVPKLSAPYSVIADQSGTMYVAEHAANRVTRWFPGAKSGVAIAGDRGQGYLADQLSLPTDIAFDNQGNLYVADYGNHRVQMFAINKTSCQ